MSHPLLTGGAAALLVWLAGDIEPQLAAWALVVRLLRPLAIRRLRAKAPLTGWHVVALRDVLYADYLRGVISTDALERCASVQPGPAWTRLSWALRRGVVNSYVCVEVAAGRYREALEWRQRWLGPEHQHRETSLFDALPINEAEARFCLGQSQAAISGVADLDASDPFVLAGRAAHLAWVLASIGHPEQGREALARAERDWLPPDYQAEWHLSEAAIALASRDWAGAVEAIDGAEAVARRASTRRNLSFMRGLVARGRGEHAAAIEHFALGAADTYQGQGGEALLAWGDSLAELGRVEEARAAWALCAERDPQSPFAAQAATRPKASEHAPPARHVPPAPPFTQRPPRLERPPPTDQPPTAGPKRRWWDETRLLVAVMTGFAVASSTDRSNQRVGRGSGPESDTQFGFGFPYVPPELPWELTNSPPDVEPGPASTQPLRQEEEEEKEAVERTCSPRDVPATVDPDERDDEVGASIGVPGGVLRRQIRPQVSEP